MVKYIGEESAKLRSEPCGNRPVLVDAEVHVADGLAAIVANAAVVTIVDAQNRVAEAIIDRSRIREQVRGTSNGRAHKVIVTGRTEASVAADIDGICIGPDVA